MASAATPKGPLNWLRADPELPQARTNVGVVGPVAPRAGLVSRLPMNDAPTTPRSRMDVRMEYSFRRRPLLLHRSTAAKTVMTLPPAPPPGNGFSGGAPVVSRRVRI